MRSGGRREQPVASDRQEQPRNWGQPPPHWIGREPQSFKRVRSEQRRSARFAKYDEGKLRASVHSDPGTPDVPLYPAAIRQDKCIPRVRDYPQAVKEGRRKGRVRGAGVHERLDSLVALASRIPYLDAHAKGAH